MNRDKSITSVWKDELTMHLGGIFLSRIDLSYDASQPNIGKERITPYSILVHLLNEFVALSNDFFFNFETINCRFHLQKLQ